MGSLGARLMDVISDYGNAIKRLHNKEDELEQAFADVEKDLHYRRWLDGQELNPVRARGLGREAVINAEWVRQVNGLFDELQHEVVVRDIRGSLAQIERLREFLENSTV